MAIVIAQNLTKLQVICELYTFLAVLIV